MSEISIEYMQFTAVDITKNQMPEKMSIYWNKVIDGNLKTKYLSRKSLTFNRPNPLLNPSYYQ